MQEMPQLLDTRVNGCCYAKVLRYNVIMPECWSQSRVYDRRCISNQSPLTLFMSENN